MSYSHLQAAPYGHPAPPTPLEPDLWQFYCVQNMAMVKKVKALAAQKGCTPGQLALAWVLARGDDVIPIPGTKRANCCQIEGHADA